MKSLLRRYCILLALLVYWLPSVHGQPALKVNKVEIRHVGPISVSDELIKANIRVKQGDTYSRTSIDDDVRNLYNTGYFYNIQVLEEVKGTEVSLAYVVQGKPTLMDIKFEGNDKFSVSKLKKEVKSKVGDPLDERKLFTDAQAIKTKYQKSGYQKTEVKYSLNIVEATGRGSVTFEIVESPKVRVKQIVFDGAQAFSQRKLAKTIKTRERWFMSWLTGSGVLKDDQFEEDKEKLADFYRNEGYIDFEIKDVKFDQLTPKKMAITFVLFEGKQYKVGTVDIKGNSLFTKDEIIEQLKRSRGKAAVGEHGLEADAGGTFSPKALSRNIDRLQDVYGAKGYIDAKVVAVKTPNTETGTMDLVYQIQENQKSFIEKIEIRGNAVTKDKVIRRELAVAPGEVFDMVRVKLSQKRLEGLDYFERVNAQPEPTDIPNRRNLVMSVEEKRTGNLSLGAGFSSVDSVVGFVELSQGNFDLFKAPTFTGGGQKFRLRAAVGTQRQDYQISFIEPWFLERKLALGVDLYHRELSFLSDLYDEKRTGGRLSLTRALGSDFLIGTASYTLEDVGIKNVNPAASPTILAEAGTRLVSKMGANIAYDTRNSTFLPNGGQRTELSTEMAGGPFGGETDFYKLEAKTAWYFKGFAEGHVFELNGRVGVVEEYGDTTRVPLFDRYFLGGLYSLRGYRFRQVGPRDVQGEPIGGGTYWYSTAEYSIPIIERLRFALFYDIGMVYQDSYSFSEKGNNTGFFNDNWGLGFRLNLPIGPLRLDYGVPIKDDGRNGGSGRFQFSVGYTRDF